MRVINVEQQLCPCKKEYQEFQKLVELKDTGLVVYCHRPRKENIKQAKAVESAVNTSSDVFILHNKKDVKITTSELPSELETNNIRCARCRKTFEHAQKLLQEVKSIDRKTVMGICDHCCKKSTTTAKTSKKRFCTCDEIEKKFIHSVKGEQKEDIKKYVKIWLSTMGDLLKDDITLNKPKQIKTRAYYDIEINRGLYSPGSRHEPEIQQMFYSGTHKSDINLNTEMREPNLKEGHMKQAVSFFQPIEHVESSFDHTPHEKTKKSTTSLEDSDTTLVETYIKKLPRTSIIDHKQEEVFEDIPSMDAKEALKRRHDLSLRQMMGLEKDSRVPFSLSKRPDIYETPKIPPWAQKEPTSKYHVESEVGIEIPTLKYDHGPRGIRDLDYVSNREVKIRSTRAAQDSFNGRKKANKYHLDKVKQGLYDSEEGPKKVKKLEDRYITDEELKLQRRVDSISNYAEKSEQHVARSKSWHKNALEPKESVGFVLKPHFSFFFPEIMDKEKSEVELNVSSSHLIKDTQERFRLQAESDMKLREEERQENLGQDQKKELAPQEKKLQVEEKKRQAIEDEKYAQDQKIQQDKAKRHKIKGDTFDDILSEFEQKDKISKESHFAEKYTKSKHTIDKELDEAKKNKKLKSEQEDEIDKVLQRAKKDTTSEHRIDEKLDEPKLGPKLKPEQGDKIDKVLLKARKEKQSEHRIYEELDKPIKGTKSKPEQGDKIDKVLQGAKKDTKSKHRTDEELDEAKKSAKSKPEQVNTADELLKKTRKETQSEHRIYDEQDGAKKGTKSKPEQGDKIDKVLQGAKKDTKSKHRTDEELDEAKKGTKAKPEQVDTIDEPLQKARPEKGDKISELLQKAKNDLKFKPKSEDKIDEVLEKTQQGHKIDKVLQGAKKDTKSKHRTDEGLDEAKKGTKSKPEQVDTIDEPLQKARPEKGDKISELLQKAKDDLKFKPEREDKIDEVLEKTQQEHKIDKVLQGAKKDTKSKHRTDEVLDEAKKGTKSKPEQVDTIDEPLQKVRPEKGDKISELLQKAKDDLKFKPEREDKIDEVLEKTQQGHKIDKVLQGAKKDTKSKHRTDGELDEAKKGTKSKPEQVDTIDEPLQKVRPEKGDKISELLQKAKDDLKFKPEREDKIDEVLEKTQQGHKIDKVLQGAKKDTKSKHRTDGELDEAKKGTKAKPEQVDTIDEPLQKARPEKGDKISELLQKAKNDLKFKPEREDKIGEVLEKTKKLVKNKSELKEKEDDEVRDKGKKDTKRKRETADKDDEIAEEGKKGLKGKPESIKKGSKELKSGIEQNYKGEIELKIKTEEEKVTEKLHREKERKENEVRLKQIEQLRNEKEANKKQLAKEREKVPKEMTTKIKRDFSKEIKVSISKIQKTIKDEPAQKIVFSVKKQEKKEKEVKQKEVPVAPSQHEIQFKKLQAEHLKTKEEALKKKKQLQYEAEVAKALKEAELKSKTAEVKLSDINMKTGLSEQNLILKSIQIKQAAKIKPSEIDAEIIKEHKCHDKSFGRTSFCPLCVNSQLELDVLSLESNLNVPKEIISDIIIGEQIFKIKSRLEKTKEAEVDPKIYRKIYFVESDLPPKEIVKIIPQEAEPVRKQILSNKDAVEMELEPGKGILHYALSDRTFIDNGWTMLPTEKVVRKMNVYRMRPAHPEFDWFEHNKNKRLMTYDTGERLAEFDDNGRGRLFYRSGRLALDYYDAEETNAQQRFVIYSSGEPDERGRTHPITILATFDYLGNGIVFDHTGKIRLKYNQTEGVVLDRGIGPVSHWKWHTLNDPPVLQQVMIDTQMAHKDPNILKLGPASEKATRPDNEEMLAIEFDNFIKEKSKKLSQKFKPFQIKMKALKINEHFSLKVLDQATVYLIFRDGSTNLKLNIGMVLDHQEIVDTDTAEVGEVSNSLERFPARTDSLAGLQRSVAHAQRYERLQIERERRFRPPEPCASADHLTAAASPPMRLPLRTVPSRSSSTGYCSRKPTNNLYYNTRLL